MTTEKCSKIKQRIAHDKRHGKTTSQAVLDFIRRSCDCEVCKGWREQHPKGER